MNMLARAVAIAGALLLGLPALAAADADQRRDRTISSQVTAANPTVFRGSFFWSVDRGNGRHRLVERGGSRTFITRVKPQQEPFDADVGPSAIGTIEVAYARCEGLGAAYDCDLHRFDPTSTFDHRPRGLSTDACNEIAPSIWRGRIAFVRAIPEGELAGRPRCRRPGLYLARSGAAARRIDAAVPVATDIRGHLVAAGYQRSTRGGGTVSRIVLIDLRSGARRVIATGRTDRMGRGVRVADPAFDRGTLHYLFDEGVALRRVVGVRVGAGGADVITDERSMDAYAVADGRLYYAARGIFEYR